MHLHEQLLASAALTTDAAEADAFFVPFYSACFLASHFVHAGPAGPHNDVNIGRATRIGRRFCCK